MKPKTLLLIVTLACSVAGATDAPVAAASSKVSDQPVSAQIVDMPPRALLSIYETWIGKKVSVPADIAALKTPVILRIVKEKKSDAVPKVERALREQAGIEVVREPDGILSARRIASAR